MEGGLPRPRYTYDGENKILKLKKKIKKKKKLNISLRAHCLTYVRGLLQVVTEEFQMYPVV